MSTFHISFAFYLLAALTASAMGLVVRLSAQPTRPELQCRRLAAMQLCATAATGGSGDIVETRFGDAAGGLINASKLRAELQYDIVEARVLVKGVSVHGPYYRTIVKNEAVMLRKLKGRYSELDDGLTTEVIVQGHKDRVAGFLRWVEKGPPLALRDPVNVVSIEYRSQLSEFGGFDQQLRA